MSVEERRRVLIVNPPAYEGVDYIREGRCMQSRDSWTALWPPLTLMYLSAILKDRFETRLIDAVGAHLSREKLLDVCGEFRPFAIIVNTSFPTIAWDLSLAEMAKGVDPAVRVLAVGMFPTLLPGETLERWPAVDFAIVGEPEFAVRDLLVAIAQGAGFAHMPSIAYREEGKVVLPDTRLFIENLDDLPFPDRDSLSLGDYTFPLDGQPFTLVNFGRGCPMPCIFCTAPLYYGKRFRRRSPASFVDELALCSEKYGIRNFIFWGETVALDREYIIDVCTRINERKLDISWGCASRADHLDDGLLGAMKKAGCFMTSLGIESASQAILDRAGKSISIRQIEETCARCRKAGIKVMGHFIIGLPGETKETVDESLRFACRNVDFAQFYCAVPYPGTELYRLLDGEGRLHISSWQDLGLSNALISTESLSAAELQKLRERCFRAFYLRPGFLLRNLAMIGSPRALLDRLKFLKWFSSRPRAGR